MKRRSSIAVMMALLAFAGLYPAAAMAQYEGLPTGSRLRVTLNVGEGLPASVTKGYLKGIHEEYLTFVNDSSVESMINQGRIIKLEQLRGTRRNGAKGFLVGAAVGGVLGFLMGVASVTSEPETSGDLAGLVLVPIAGSLGYGMLGGVVGLIIGASTVTEKWEHVAPVYQEAPVASAFYPVAALPRVGVRINF